MQIPRGVLAGAIFGIGEWHHNLGTGRQRSVVVGIDVIHNDIDAASLHRPRIDGIGFAASRQHHHAAPKGEHGVADIVIGGRHFEVAPEAESTDEPVDSGSAIAVAEDRINVGRDGIWLRHGALHENWTHQSINRIGRPVLDEISRAQL